VLRRLLLAPAPRVVPVAAALRKPIWHRGWAASRPGMQEAGESGKFWEGSAGITVVSDGVLVIGEPSLLTREFPGCSAVRGIPCSQGHPWTPQEEGDLWHTPS
jgi:hypothetical protein